MGESVAAFVLGNGPAKVTSYNFLQLRGGLSPRIFEKALSRRMRRVSSRRHAAARAAAYT